MRRSDREVVGLANVLAILDQCEVLRIGLCVDDKPYIVPMNFAYVKSGEDISVYLHCAPKGRKLDIIARNSNVCFEADCSYKTLEAEAACGWSAEFQSVLGEGTIAVVSDEAQKIAALDVLMKRYGFIGKPEYQAQSLATVTILRISVTSMTGKSKPRR